MSPCFDTFHEPTFRLVWFKHDVLIFRALGQPSVPQLGRIMNIIPDILRVAVQTPRMPVGL